MAGLVDPRARYDVFTWDGELGRDGGWVPRASGLGPRHLMRELRGLWGEGWDSVSYLVERSSGEPSP